jgi:hypothetical protein
MFLMFFIRLCLLSFCTILAGAITLASYSFLPFILLFISTPHMFHNSLSLSLYVFIYIYIYFENSAKMHFQVKTEKFSLFWNELKMCNCKYIHFPNLLSFTHLNIQHITSYISHKKRSKIVEWEIASVYII